MSTRGNSKIIIALSLTIPTLITWIYFVALRSHSAGVQQSAYTLGKTIQFAIPLIWVFKTRRADLKIARPSQQGLLIGIAFGLLIAAAMWVIYSFGLKPRGFFDVPGVAIRNKIEGLDLNTSTRFIAVACFYAICHSFLEEYYWRWFVFRELRTVTGLTWAISLSSLGFMAHHILVLAAYFGWMSPATWLFSAAVAIGGAVWAWLYERSQSLSGPWASHCLVDAAIFVIGFDLVRDIFR